METDLANSLQFACEIKREHSENFWKENISFYLDGVSLYVSVTPQIKRAPQVVRFGGNDKRNKRWVAQPKVSIAGPVEG